MFVVINRASTFPFVPQLIAPIMWSEGFEPGRNAWLLAYELAETTIAFKLRLGEPLVECTLAGECRVFSLVIEEVDWLRAGKSGLDVKDASLNRIVWVGGVGVKDSSLGIGERTEPLGLLAGKNLIEI